MESEAAQGAPYSFLISEFGPINTASVPKGAIKISRGQHKVFFIPKSDIGPREIVLGADKKT